MRFKSALLFLLVLLLRLDPTLDFFFGGLAEGPGGALGLGAKSWEGVGIMASKS